jgi:hypothetical protein
MDRIREGAQGLRPAQASVLSLTIPHIVVVHALESDESIPRAGNYCCPGATTLGCVIRAASNKFFTHDYTY